jgi:hypothetical protein
MRLIAGSAFGETSPAKTFSPMFYLGVEAKAGADIPLPQEYEERALYILAGAVDIDGARHKRGSMIVFAKNAVPMIAAAEDSKLMLLGGAPIGERKIWWNLVSSSQERIEKAKADWTASAAQNFQGTVFTLPPDETEHIPLPAE